MSSFRFEIKTHYFMLFSLENQRSLDVRVKICTISMQIDEESHIFVGVKDGQLLVFSAESID